MAKILVALSAGLIVGITSAATAQQIGTPASPSGTSPATTGSPLTPTPNSSPLTPAPVNSAITTQSSSEVPAIINASPTELIRVDPAAASQHLLLIDPNSLNVSILSPGALSTPQTATGVALNTILAPAITTAMPAPSPNSPSFYPAIIGAPASTATFLSSFGSTSTFGRPGLARTSPAGAASTPIARIAR